MAKEKIPAVPTTVVKNKVKRNILEAKLHEAAELKAQLKLITNKKPGEPVGRGRLDILQFELQNLFMELNEEKFEFEGKIHALTLGKNVTVSQERLKTSLMNNLTDVNLIKKILAESVKESTYTTITTTDVKSTDESE